MRIDGPRTAEFEDALDLATLNPAAPQPLCTADRLDEFTPEVPPDEAATKALCAGCPLLAICKTSARQEKPSTGIRGGIAWHKGKQYHWLVKLGHSVDDGEEFDDPRTNIQSI